MDRWINCPFMYLKQLAMVTTTATTEAVDGMFFARMGNGIKELEKKQNRAHRKNKPRQRRTRDDLFRRKEERARLIGDMHTMSIFFYPFVGRKVRIPSFFGSFERTWKETQDAYMPVIRRHWK